MCRREEGEAGDHGQERKAGLTDAGRVLDTIRDGRVIECLSRWDWHEKKLYCCRWKTG